MQGKSLLCINHVFTGELIREPLVAMPQTVHASNSPKSVMRGPSLMSILGLHTHANLAASAF